LANYIRAKMIGGGRPLLPEILDQTDRVGAKSPIFDLFARSDSAVTPIVKNLQLTYRFEVISALFKFRTLCIFEPLVDFLLV